MPYGRRTYTARSGPSRRSFGSRKTPTRQTKKVLRTKNARSARVSNARAIDRVRRTLKTVRNRTYGEYQQSHQVLESAIVPTKSAPCLLNISNAQVNARVWQPVMAPGAMQGTLPVSTEVNKFVRPTYTTTGFWSGSQDDVINGKHMLLSSTYNIEVSFTRYTYPQTVRIDCFIVKKTLLMSLKQEKQLPNSLHQLHSMATTDNRFNPQYFFKIGKPRFLTCAGSDALGAYDTAQHEYTHKRHAVFKFKHNKVIAPAIELSLDEDEAIGDPFATIPVTTEDDDQDASGYQGMSPDQILWMLVSTDVDQYQDHRPQVKISRHVAWRDHQGAAV